MFKHAGDEHAPRQVERIEKSKPHEKNVLIRFQFGKNLYALLIDSAAEDDVQYIHEQVTDTARSIEYSLIENPQGEGLTTYAMPYRAKECYLLFRAPTHVRLDVAMTERLGEHSRSTYQKMISAGQVQVNGSTQTLAKFPVSESDTISVQQQAHVVTKHAYDTLYEDEHVLVINKPIGMLTHSKGALNEEFSAADCIKPYTTYKTETNRPGIVHRLDRATSGVLVMVKTAEAAKKIQQQFSERTVKKTYHAVVTGVPTPSKAMIDLPIERNPNAPSTFRVGPSGKPAQTVYEVISTNEAHTLVELRPRTGRTHQLRVHMQYINTPILGDAVYGTESAERMYLHASSLELTLPGGLRKVFNAPLPDVFSALFS
jgi:23S rRNA pseudouridine1911/1915/1917 synthase